LQALAEAQLTAKPLDWISWWDALQRMPKIRRVWAYDHDAAKQAMTRALRSGQVHNRGEVREFDWRFGDSDLVALREVISTLRKLHVYRDEAVVEYEIAITEMTTFGSDLFRVSRPHTRKAGRTARIRNPELVWPEFRDYLILFELPAGEKPNSDLRSDSLRRGRIPNPVWKHAKAEAILWLGENGYPEPGDGGQGNLEKHITDWLADRDHHPAESTVRSYVAGWISEYRDNLG
jgi:hypothetical protein